MLGIGRYGHLSCSKCGWGDCCGIWKKKSAIGAMYTYLDRKRNENSLSNNERQQQIDYGDACLKIGKSICPSCERSLDFGNTDLDFCPHCGIHLFEYCPNCSSRNSTFNHYCFKYGLASKTMSADGE